MRLRRDFAASVRYIAAPVDGKNAARLLPGRIVEIALTSGYVALVDLADWPRVRQFRWHAAPRHRRNAQAPLVYASARCHGRRVYLHQLISDGRVDHRNGDGLDNRRANLRPATQAQNAANTRRRSDNSVGFRGVTKDRRTGRFIAQLHHDGKHHHLGVHDTAEAAARAYDVKATEMFGAYARLNYPAIRLAEGA